MSVPESTAGNSESVASAPTIERWRRAAALIESLAHREGLRCSLREGRLVLRPASAVLSAERRAEIDALQAHVGEFLAAEALAGAEPLPTPSDRQRAPLALGQRQMYRTMQVDGLTENFHISNVMRIEGRIDLARLCRCVEATVAGHHALLTRFVPDAEAPEGVVQMIDADRAVHCDAFDWRERPPAERDAALSRLIDDNRRTPFDLAQGPLHRLAAVWLDGTTCFLLMTFHHLVLDDWSMGLLHREIAHRYASDACEAPAWRGGSDDYLRFVDWQARWLDSPDGVRSAAYWEERLQRLPALLELPTDRPRTASIDNRCASIAAAVDVAVASRIRDLTGSNRTSVFPLLFAAFCVLVWRLSLRRRFAVATLVANRDVEAFEHTIGLFFNTIVLAVDVDPERTFAELAADVSRVVFEGLERGALPFLRLVERLCESRDVSFVPLAQVLFSFANAPQPRVDAGSVSIEKGGGGLDVGSGYDMRVTAYEADGAFNFVMQYRTALIDEATARAWLSVYLHLLASVADDPHAAVKNLRLQDDDVVADREVQIVQDEWGRPVPPGFVGRAPDTRQWARRLPSGAIETWSDAGPALQIDGQPLSADAVNNVLLDYPGVRDAAITPEAGGGWVAHVVVAKGGAVDALALKRHLFARLPSYAVPARLRQVPRIPLRVGGAVDVASLQALGADLGTAAAPSPPTDERMAALLAIWSDTLRAPRLGVDDDFFAVGGNSLTGALIVAAVNRQFRCKSTLRQLFEARTVSRHAAALRQLQSDSVPAAQSRSTDDGLTTF